MISLTLAYVKFRRVRFLIFFFSIQHYFADEINNLFLRREEEMTLIEIIYTVTIGAGIIAGITVVFAFISVFFKGSKKKNAEVNPQTELKPHIYVGQTKPKNSLFSVYKNMLDCYPDFCAYLNWKERSPIGFDKREIIRSH